MALECGIVGLPNVGKSTLFNALTSAENAQAANYPFCTIDPNVGTVEVPDERLDKITEFVQPKKTIPTTVSFVDIAGLVAGASKGEGLGNQFLGHIKNCDAIAQVVRCFEDDDITHVSGSVDSLRDIEIIETELMLADLATVESNFKKTDKLARSGDGVAKKKLAFLEQVKKSLEDGVALRKLKASPEEWELVRDLHLISSKPTIYVGNLKEEEASLEAAEKNPHYIKLKKYAQANGAEVVAVSAKIESELVGLEKEEKEAFLSELNIKEPGLNRLIRSTYSLLGLRTFFTAGKEEVRAWTFKEGMRAPQTAGVIHGDFERGFICAETFHYEDLLKHGSEQKVKDSGLLRTEGKEYVAKDGDIFHFRFNV